MSPLEPLVRTSGGYIDFRMNQPSNKFSTTWENRCKKTSFKIHLFHKIGIFYSILFGDLKIFVNLNTTSFIQIDLKSMNTKYVNANYRAL